MDFKAIYLLVYNTTFFGIYHICLQGIGIYTIQGLLWRQVCRRYSSYWISTEMYDARKIYMDMDFDGLRLDIVRMLGGYLGGILLVGMNYDRYIADKPHSCVIEKMEKI